MTDSGGRNRRQMVSSSRPHVAVIAHVFYLDIWPDVNIAIKNLVAAAGGGVVLFATYPRGHREIADAIARDFPDAVVRPVNNVGWDVWPFLFVLNNLKLLDWDLIVKLHTKRNVDSMWINFRPFPKPDGWRKALLSFCSSVNVAQRSLRAFVDQPRLGMVAGARVIDANGYGMGRSIKDCKKTLEAIGISSRGGVIVWGTMWMVRARLLRPFWRRWTEKDFPVPDPGNPHAGYGLAGDCEVLFGTAVCAQGYYVADGRGPGWWVRMCFMSKALWCRILRLAADCARRLWCGSLNVEKCRV